MYKNIHFQPYDLYVDTFIIKTVIFEYKLCFLKWYIYHMHFYGFGYMPLYIVPDFTYK